MKKNYETIKNLLKDIIRQNKVKVQVFGGKNNYGSLAPGFQKEKWVDVVNLTRLDNCEGGVGLIVKKKEGGTSTVMAVSWFSKVRLKK